MLPIFITGAPRSGKTIIAELLAVCGVFCGDVARMGENVMLSKMLSEYLEKSGFDKQGYLTFPSTDTLEIPKQWRQQIDIEIRKQGYEYGPWLFKSHNITTTWPLYANAYPNAKFIIVKRAPQDIANSCTKTKYYTAYDTKDGWLKMANTYNDRLNEMQEAPIASFTIDPHKLAQGDYEEVFALLRWLGLPWRNEILEIIDPKFWKIRKKAV